MRYMVFGWLMLAISALSTPATAETCGGQYTVEAGDTLSVIAEKLYAQPGLWTDIHTKNISLIGPDPSALRAGMRLSINCIGGRPEGLDGAATVQVVTAAQSTFAPVGPGRIEVLTATGFPPFADRSLPGGGLLVEVVEAALDAAGPAQGYAVHWVDDRQAHKDPLLSNALLDMGFPWSMPDCSAAPEAEACATFIASERMFEMLTLVFVRVDKPLTFASDADFQGKTLCRPEGFSTHILNQRGRNWVQDGVVTLVRAASAEACLRLVVEGQVDGAVLNEFLGRSLINSMQLRDRVQAADGLPVAIESSHMVVHRAHPNGPEVLAVFDEGLRRIKADGTFQQIVDAHMTRHWAEF